MNAQTQIEQEEKTMQIFLTGLGFEEKEGKEGCWSKEVKKENKSFYLYWDLRKEKPFFYIYDDAGEKIAKKEFGTFSEYMSFSEKFNIKEEKQKKEKQEQKEQSLEVLENKNQAFDIMNQRDDSQVLLEIQGSFMEEFVYSFKTKEGQVTGLSWVGTKEVARQMGNISVEDCEILEKSETYLVKCKAKDIARNVTMFGVAEQSKKMRFKSGEEQVDLHALSKCVSRAQRNAIRGLIPEIFIKKMIEQYLKGE